MLSRDISYQNTKFVNKTDWVTTKGGVGCLGERMGVVGEVKDQNIGNQRGLTSVRRGIENYVITNTTDEQNVEISQNCSYQISQSVMEEKCINSIGGFLPKRRYPMIRLWIITTTLHNKHHQPC